MQTPAVERTQPPPPPPADRLRQAVERIDQVAPGLYISDAVAAQSARDLRARGITMVVKAFSDDARNGAYQRVRGVQYRVVPAEDTPDFDMLAWMVPVARVIEDELHRGGCVLVHCHMGISRSATLLAAFMMLFGGLSAKQAVAKLQAARPVVRPNPGFQAQLRRLEAQLVRT